MWKIFSTILLLSLLISCGSGSSSNSSDSSSPAPPPAVPPITAGNWYQPSVLATWQWQLQGAVNTSYNVDIYDIDLFDSSEALIQQLQQSGKKVICYFSAGSYEEWRSDADQFLADDLGNPLDGWAGERWLDIRSDNVHTIMKNRLDLAVQKGCDGVEPDNMDGYSNSSGFAFTATDQLGFNRLIANEAHLRSLSIGLKNDLDQISELVDYYDFAVNEQCFEYQECDLLAPFINNGKAVLNAEYEQKYVNDVNERDALCVDSISRQFSTLILPLSLDDSFRFSCF
ncbi:MAG: endo alpha-1,4 polygalactosaminidase [Desulfuromusa sp.]|nr:endo alpha-1,4 polygalactosaminidase [Desulfuromusa sp.]